MYFQKKKLCEGVENVKIERIVRERKAGKMGRSLFRMGHWIGGQYYNSILNRKAKLF